MKPIQLYFLKLAKTRIRASATLMVEILAVILKWRICWSSQLHPGFVGEQRRHLAASQQRSAT